MVIETRYRDIPFEEAVSCGTGFMTPEGWEKRRGSVVRIRTPAVTRAQYNEFHFKCDGPFYETLLASRGGSNWRVLVCPHIAEIGD